MTISDGLSHAFIDSDFCATSSWIQLQNGQLMHPHGSYNH